MSTFGELLDPKRPTVILFYDESDMPETHALFNQVAASVGDAAKFVKIDRSKNHVLSDALRVKDTPQILVYAANKLSLCVNGPIVAVKLIDEILNLIPAGQRV